MSTRDNRIERSIRMMLQYAQQMADAINSRTTKPGITDEMRQTVADRQRPTNNGAKPNISDESPVVGATLW